MPKPLFTPEEWKKNLIGTAEVFLFMRQAIARFDNTRNAAIKSFIFPVAILPFILLIAALQSTGFSFGLLLSVHLFRIVLSLALFFTAVYFLSKQYNRQEHFYRFMNITNWSNIPAFLLILPIFIGLFMGHSIHEMESYAVFITLVGYVYSAFILTHTFRFPWEFGGFVAIVGLAIDENMYDITSHIRDLIAA